MQAKQTQPPPRYNEGTLVDAMQNAWRFVKDEALRERLKEAKGIGTPATRAEIIKGLKRQNLLAADGKLVVPTPAGLQLFELLRGAAPALVDPGTTAVWEMRLDDVVMGKADFRAVIDEIAERGGPADQGAPPSLRRQTRPRRSGGASGEDEGDAEAESQSGGEGRGGCESSRSQAPPVAGPPEADGDRSRTRHPHQRRRAPPERAAIPRPKRCSPSPEPSRSAGASSCHQP